MMNRGTTIGLDTGAIVRFGPAFFLAVWAIVQVPGAARGGEAVKRFTAKQIKQWRERAAEIGALPEGTPEG